MSLKLKLESFNNERLEQLVAAEMRGTTFTIGRAKDNDWVLPPAFRTVSRHHCRIECRDGSYHIVGFKKNVGLVRTQSVLRQGQSEVLQDKDILLLGTCKISLRIINASEKSQKSAAHTAHTETIATRDKQDTDTAPDIPDVEDSLPNLEYLLDPRRAKRRSQAIQPPPRQDPRAPSPPPAKALPQHADQTVLLRAFLKGAGLGKLEVAPEQAETMMEEIGHSFQIMIAGIIEMLAARNSGRRELKAANRTMIGLKTNPLKFPPSKDWDTTLGTMLLHDKPNYMPLEEAVDEGLDDIKSYQLAIMETMHKALQGLLERLDPATLEQNLTPPSLLEQLWPHKRRARCWMSFTEEYEKIDSEDLLSLIRDHFADSHYQE